MNKHFLLSKNLITGKVLDERLAQLLETIKKEGIVVHVDKGDGKRSIEVDRIVQLENILERQQERISELEKKVFGKETEIPQKPVSTIPKAPPFKPTSPADQKKDKDDANTRAGNKRSLLDELKDKVKPGTSPSDIKKDKK